LPHLAIYALHLNTWSWLAIHHYAGGIGGACGVVAGQPLDTVRIRQQAPGAGGGGARAIIRSILAAEGARSLFRGMSYPLMTAALQVGLLLIDLVWRCWAALGFQGCCGCCGPHRRCTVCHPACRPATGTAPVLPTLFFLPLSRGWVQNAVVFQAYGAAARFIAPQAQQQQQQPLSLSHVFWAGCFAGVVQTVSSQAAGQCLRVSSA